MENKCTEATISLQNDLVAVIDTVRELEARLIQAGQEFADLRAQLTQDSAAHARYQRNKDRLEETQEQIRKLAGVLGPERFNYVSDRDAAAPLEGEVTRPINAGEERSKLSLWEVLRVFLKANGTSQVGDIQDFLMIVHFGEISRQAIESAVRRHPEIFRVTKKNRERFISLKGA